MSETKTLPRWLKVGEEEERRTVWLDGGFTCHRPGPVTLHHGAAGWFFRCRDGKHYIDGQLDDDGDHYVGIFVSDPGPLEWQQADYHAA